MNVSDILDSVKSGKLSVNEAKKQLSLYSIEEIENFAKIDLGREARKGIPEVIFAERKENSEVKKIIKNVLKKTNSIVVSRILKKNYEDICNYCKKNNFKVSTGQNCTTILVYKKPIKKTNGKVGIITAGTSDIGIAEESRLMCESMNCNCMTSYDVGIAGLHRIFPVLKEFVKSRVDAIIVVAGMEGALASVVSSTVNVPIIGVPTSIGYGYGEKGVAALAAMLQSCSLGLTVVNIDNGIGAGAAAAKIANQINKK
jgi:pyridinium-3,5-biscarboxylic acid mononucleotide synthase